MQRLHRLLPRRSRTRRPRHAKAVRKCRLACCVKPKKPVLRRLKKPIAVKKKSVCAHSKMKSAALKTIAVKRKPKRLARLRKQKLLHRPLLQRRKHLKLLSRPLRPLRKPLRSLQRAMRLQQPVRAPRVVQQRLLPLRVASPRWRVLTPSGQTVRRVQALQPVPVRAIVRQRTVRRIARRRTTVRPTATTRAVMIVVVAAS